MTKQCKKCKNIKLLKEFHSHVNKNNTKVHSSCCTLCRRETAREWNKVNREKHVAHQATWRHTHPELDVQRSTDRLKRLEHKIKARLRTRLYDALNGNQKKGSAIKDLGCSIAELKIRIESM